MLLFILSSPSPAQAQSEVFLRVFHSTGLKRGGVSISYGLEGARGMREYLRTGTEGGGGGGGGGGDGARSYDGVTHRIQAGVGMTDWLAIGVEQTIRQPGTEPASLGVIAPELRLQWNPLIAGLRDAPVQLATFVGSRLRVNARRPHSAVVGVGINGDAGRAHLAADLGFETTLDDELRENGLRYRLGASFDVVRDLNLALELWGTFVWPEDGVFQQDHHGGPSIRYQLGPLWVGGNVAFGVKERPNKVFLDLGFMGQMGVRW